MSKIEIRYSRACDTSLDAYREYCSLVREVLSNDKSLALLENGGQLVSTLVADIAGEPRCTFTRLDSAETRGLLVGDAFSGLGGRVNAGSEGVEVSRTSSGDVCESGSPVVGEGVVGGFAGVSASAEPCVDGLFGSGRNRQSHDRSAFEDPARGSCGMAAGGDETLVDSPPVRGRWYFTNRQKKLRKKEKKNCMQSNWRIPAVTGFAETLVSGVAPRSACPSYGQALSDAERDARDSLAQRRAAENKVAKKLAEMKLASLEDEKKCQEYADLKHQRVIQWTNEATAKSQQSVDKLKSIDPSSSASQYEIRQQAKKLADAEAEVRRVSSIVKTLSPDWQELLERKAESTFNTEYVDELMALGAAGRDNGFNY